MKTKIKYCSQLKTTKNTKTGKTFYFVNKCDHWARISQKEYREREDSSIYCDSMMTCTEDHFIYQFKTIYMGDWR